MITIEQRKNEFHVECNPDGVTKCCSRCATSKPLREFRVSDEPKLDPEACTMCDLERSKSHACLVCDITRCGQHTICMACEKDCEIEQVQQAVEMRKKYIALTRGDKNAD